LKLNVFTATWFIGVDRVPEDHQGHVVILQTGKNPLCGRPRSIKFWHPVNRVFAHAGGRIENQQDVIGLRRLTEHLSNGRHGENYQFPLFFHGLVSCSWSVLVVRCFARLPLTRGL
jgi:hypothetical protein